MNFPKASDIVRRKLLAQGGRAGIAKNGRGYLQLR